MILGHGNIASILQDRKGAIFFACGVSNSMTTDEDEFKRERDFMLDLPRFKNDCMFYFGSISIFYKESRYTEHKLKMESLVKRLYSNYNIIRIGNIDWDQNPNTFINKLRALKASGKPFEIFDEYRYMISKEELLLMTNNLPLKGRNEINCFGTMKKVKDLI